MEIYVASSWRNSFQPEVVKILRSYGHNVYDFKDSEGFHWEEVQENPQNWTPEQYLENLRHPASDRGFNRDMEALQKCDICVYVMPCGVSASMEAGWAKGMGKIVIGYFPAIREPDLMVKMFDFLTTDILDIQIFIAAYQNYQ